MKAILLLVISLAAVSCAEYSGATYAAPTTSNAPYYSGNGDAGGATDPARGRVISEFKARTFMTDFKAARFGPRGATVAGQNQSKVPIKLLNTGERIAAGVVAGKLAEAVSNNGSAEVINASDNALKTTQAKEATKQLSIQTGAATEALRIAKP